MEIKMVKDKGNYLKEKMIVADNLAANITALAVAVEQHLSYHSLLWTHRNMHFHH